jgi:hypothetical protein
MNSLELLTQYQTLLNNVREEISLRKQILEECIKQQTTLKSILELLYQDENALIEKLNEQSQSLNNISGYENKDGIPMLANNCGYDWEAIKQLSYSQYKDVFKKLFVAFSVDDKLQSLEQVKTLPNPILLELAQQQSEYKSSTAQIGPSDIKEGDILQRYHRGEPIHIVVTKLTPKMIFYRMIVNGFHNRVCQYEQLKKYNYHYIINPVINQTLQLASEENRILKTTSDIYYKLVKPVLIQGQYNHNM